MQYHSYVVDSGAENESDNEIIRTIIVKASDKQLSDNKVSDDADNAADADNTLDGKQRLDPVKLSGNYAAEPDNVQIARSVAAGTGNQIAADQTTTTTTTKKSPKFTTTTTTTTSTTTAAPTHNADGENIEQVRADEVSIAQAPLVTAFTIQQDLSGRPNSVVPLAIHQQQQQNQHGQQLLNFVPALAVTMQPPTTQAAQFFRQSNNPQLTGNVFDQAQKQLQLEQQVAYLQQQQRQQEAIFREQQHQFNRQAAQRQQELLLEQRVRIENDYRVKQQQYEQEIRAFRQQQAHNEARKNIQLQHLQFVEQHRQHQQEHQFVQAPPAVQQQQQFNNNDMPNPLFVQQLPGLQQQRLFQPDAVQQEFARPAAHAIEIVPSVAFGSLATQQLLPAKSAVDFQQHRSQPSGLQFQAVSFAQPHPQQQLHQLSNVQELPQRAFQAFQSNAATAAAVEVQPSVGTVFPSIESHVRSRVFRQESGTGNFGFINNDGQSDRYLQSFLHNAGLTGGTSAAGRGHTEDFNIITKVLALNHGIPNAQPFLGNGRAQF